MLSFFLAILLGTLLLMLPWSSSANLWTPFLTALFTATSAVCVTGLIVVDTATYWSPFGQFVIALLIQVGGLGILTASSFFILLKGEKINFRRRLVLRQSLNSAGSQDVSGFLRRILFLVFVFELAGILLLFPRLLADYEPLRALGLAVFHSLSAFNNAGFDLFGNSLESFVGDGWINTTVMLLILAGSTGFFVLMRLPLLLRRKWEARDLGAHVIMVVRVTGGLLLLGFVLILLFESNNSATLGPLSWPDRIWAALFQTVTPRTAGFNTISIADFSLPVLLMFMMLMFIGGSPGSTAGGIKTTTFGIIAASVVSLIRGRKDTEIERWRLSRQRVLKAWLIFFLGAGWIALAAWMLTITESGIPFLDLLFEVFSAVGTVGLSMGATSEISSAGRVVIILSMFLGRLGPLTVVSSLVMSEDERVRKPETEIPIG